MRRRILYLEPYDGGSHAAFTRTLTTGIDADWRRGLLPGRHWKWRMRGSAVHFAEACPELWSAPLDLLFASAYVPLAELVGLRPRDLLDVPRVLYFHENQLTYPTRPGRSRKRDHHFGFTQLTSALAATRCVFNSRHNLEGFLEAGRELLARLPDAVPPGWIDRIEARASVIPVPLTLPQTPVVPSDDDPARDLGPIILWSHRWEYDKNPEGFFAALDALTARGVPFRVAVCGQRFRRVPAIFARARERLGARVVHWGHAPRHEDYLELLSRAHIAVSTAAHEFFGVAMLEATHMGAFPLVPDRLAYPEIFPPEHRYASDDALVERLEALCVAWRRGDDPLRADRRAISRPFEAARVLDAFRRLFDALCAAPTPDQISERCLV